MKGGGGRLRGEREGSTCKRETELGSIFSTSGQEVL